MDHASNKKGDGRQTLPKAEILGGYRAFSKVLSDGTVYQAVSLRGHLLQVTNEFNNGVPVRVGFAVNRRVKSAAVRNRVRRLMREVYRRNNHGLVEFVRLNKRYFALVLYFRANASAKSKLPTFTQIENDFKNLVERIVSSG